MIFKGYFRKDGVKGLNGGVKIVYSPEDAKALAGESLNRELIADNFIQSK